MGMKTEEVLFHKGEAIINENDVERSMYIIKTGHVEVSKNKGMEVTKLATLGPGEYFGEMAFFDDKPRSANVTAIDETKVVKLYYSDEMVKAVNELPSWVTTILGGVFKRLRSTNEEVKKSLEEEGLNYHELKTKYLNKNQLKELWRVMALIDFLAAKYGVRKNNFTYIDLPKFKIAITEFFPAYTLGVDNTVEFLTEANILEDEPLDKDSTLFRIFDLKKVEKFRDYIKGSLRVNPKKLQVVGEEANFVEAILLSMKERIKGKHLEKNDRAFKELQMPIDINKLNQVMKEKYHDGNTMYYLDGLYEKHMLEKKTVTKSESIFTCSPDELERSLPFLRMVSLLTNIIIRNTPKTR